MANLTDINKENKENLSVLLSGLPDYEEGKLLAVPVIPRGTGEEVAKATFKVSNKLKINSTIRGLVFDKTASNSGCRIGACIFLEKFFKKNYYI